MKLLLRIVLKNLRFRAKKAQVTENFKVHRRKMANKWRQSVLKAQSKLIELRKFKSFAQSFRRWLSIICILFMLKIIYSYYSNKIRPYILFRTFKWKFMKTFGIVEANKIDKNNKADSTIELKNKLLKSSDYPKLKSIVYCLFNNFQDRISPQFLSVSPHNENELCWLYRELKRLNIPFQIEGQNEIKNLRKDEMKPYLIKINLENLKKYSYDDTKSDITLEPGITVREAINILFLKYPLDSMLDHQESAKLFNEVLCSKFELFTDVQQRIRALSRGPLKQSEKQFIKENPELIDYFPSLEYSCKNYEPSFLYSIIKEK